MSGHLLDTNAWIALLKGEPNVTNGVRRVGADGLYLCAPVWAELWFGACKSQRIAENQARLRNLAMTVPSLPFDDRAAELCGEIRALLQREGRPIGPYDQPAVGNPQCRGIFESTGTDHRKLAGPILTKRPPIMGGRLYLRCGAA